MPQYGAQEWVQLQCNSTRLSQSCDCGFSLFALSCPLSVPTILLGFLLPWTRDISSQLLQENAATTPYVGDEVALLGHAPAPSQPPDFLVAQKFPQLLDNSVCFIGR